MMHHQFARMSPHVCVCVCMSVCAAQLPAGNPFELVSTCAVHGGFWRCAYTARARAAAPFAFARRSAQPLCCALLLLRPPAAAAAACRYTPR